MRFTRFAVALFGVAMLTGAGPASAHEEEVIIPQRAGADGAASFRFHDDDRSSARCGWRDTPETGIQGDIPVADQQSGRAQQGYNCGLAVVGYHDLGGVSGSDVTGIDHCAYVKSPEGIRVIDVSNPSAPAVVQTLPLTITSENIYARKAPDRSLLVAAGAPAAAGQPVPAYVWDVKDCRNPVLLGSVGFPGLSPGDPTVSNEIHNIELTPDGKQIYGSLPLQVADISDLNNPSTWRVRQFQCELAAQAPLGFSGILFSRARFAVNHPQCANLLAHEFEFNKSGTRMYIGGQMSGVSATQIDPLHRPWHSELQLRVVDITVWPPQIIGVAEPASGHGVRRATIGGKPFLLNSNENVNPDVTSVNGCHTDKDLIRGAAQAFLTDISDETAPQVVSELTLAINKETNCAAQLASQVRATIHYAELNDPDRTKFAMVSMGTAGLRVFDVRRPSKPREVAYWNPGMLLLANGSAAFDATSWHPRYVTLKVPCGKSSKRKCEASYILATSRLGFWVLELEPQVRLQLGLPLNFNTTNYFFGRPARPSQP